RRPGIACSPPTRCAGWPTPRTSTASSPASPSWTSRPGQTASARASWKRCNRSWPSAGCRSSGTNARWSAGSLCSRLAAPRRRRGRVEAAALGGLCQAAEAAGRLDLTRFLLRVLSRLLTEEATAERWLEGLRDRGPTMAERLQTARDALVLLGQLRTLRRWAV